MISKCLFTTNVHALQNAENSFKANSLVLPLSVRITALLWFKSYLSSRSFSVKVSNHTSEPLPLSCGVSQGSVLGPLLFILYTTPLSHLIESFSVDHHLYADNTQLFISFFPTSFSTSIAHRILSVVNQISQWMSSNLLCFNPSKTEFIMIGLPAQIKKSPTLPYNCPITHLPLLSSLMLLSAILVLLFIPIYCIILQALLRSMMWLGPLAKKSRRIRPAA